MVCLLYVDCLKLYCVFLAIYIIMMIYAWKTPLTNIYMGGVFTTIPSLYGHSIIYYLEYLLFPIIIW